jgi:hypothetical protein
MGYFLHSEATNYGSISNEKMLLAAIRFYVEAFKGRSLVSNDEMTAELCARTEEFDLKSVEDWEPYFTAARSVLGVEPC